MTKRIHRHSLSGGLASSHSYARGVTGVLLLCLWVAQAVLTVNAAPPSTIVAWGAPPSYQPAGLSNVTAIAAGDYHVLALKGDGTVVAWGYNNYGEANVPAGLSNVTAVAAADCYSMVLKSDGTVMAWGYNSYGQTNVPAGLSNVTAIAAGNSGQHAAALRKDGTVVAWGCNIMGQTNVPAGLSNVKAIVVGFLHTVVLQSNGTVVAWGWNDYGQAAVPADLSNVTAIAAGSVHTVAVKSDGTVVAWGNNWYGQTNVPAGLSNVTAAAGGLFHTVALESNGTVVAWGDNDRGQTNVPAGLSNVTAVAASDYGTLALVAGQLTITIPPQSILALHGTTVVFSVTAVASEEAPMTYQWQFNGNNMAGATGSTLTLTSLELDQSGTYTVVVRDNRGLTQSASAALTVVNAIRTLPGGYWPTTGFTVTIQCAPPLGTVDYAVEDDAPYYYYGYWGVGAISDGGTFDQNNAKVKWGPFFDDSPRTLTYVLIPPAGIGNAYDFSGKISIDGVDHAIAGMTRVSLLPLHPADNNPAIDNIISLNEVTAYAAAWKHGVSWPVTPNPIPINHMTKAGMLWKGGEYYVYAPTNPPPACWTNATPPSPIPHAPPAVLATNAFRSMTNRFAATVPFTVTVTVTPVTNVAVYAAEEKLPAGWTASNFSTSGVLDPINRMVKWGPFYDSLARVLTYQAVSPTNAAGTVVFAGAVSFDGSSATIAGLERTRSGPLVAPQFTLACSSNGLCQFTLAGSSNDIYQIDSSTNLANWLPLSAVTNLEGGVLFGIELLPGVPKCFYRATVAP